MIEWKGHPVPWVARWTGEVDRTPVSIGITRDTGITEVFYEDGFEVRDPISGALWAREGSSRTGEPEFGEVSVHRQRAAMLHRLCQVCGNKIESKVIRWMLHPDQIMRFPNETVTISPPTCDECIEISKGECPVMKKNRVIAKVLEYEPWGVMGSGARMWNGHGQLTKRAYIKYGRTDLPFAYRAVIAKQQAVAWTKFVMED